MRQLLVLILSFMLALVNFTPAQSQAVQPMITAQVGTVIAARKRRRKRRKKRKKKRRKSSKKKKKKVKKAPPKPEPKPVAEPEPEPEPEPEAAPAPAPAPEVPAADEEEERPGLAVLDMEVKAGFDAGVASLLNETMLGIINDSGRFATVISGSDMRSMLDLEQQKAALGCAEDSCIAQLGGALGVPYMFSSSIGSFAGKYLINVKIVAVDEAKVVARANAVLADENALLSGLPDLVQEALDKGFGEEEDDEDADEEEGDAADDDSDESTGDEQETPAVASGEKKPLSKRLTSSGFLLGGAMLLAGTAVATPGLALNPSNDELLTTLESYREAGAESATQIGDDLSGMIQMRQIAPPVGMLLMAGGAWIAGWNLLVGGQ